MRFKNIGEYNSWKRQNKYKFKKAENQSNFMKIRRFRKLSKAKQILAIFHIISNITQSFIVENGKTGEKIKYQRNWKCRFSSASQSEQFRLNYQKSINKLPGR